MFEKSKSVKEGGVGSNDLPSFYGWWCCCSKVVLEWGQKNGKRVFDVKQNWTPKILKKKREKIENHVWPKVDKKRLQKLVKQIELYK